MKLIQKISAQDYDFVQSMTPSKLLTNLTSDVDGVKTFVSQAISSIISSIFLIFGASILLFLIDWQLALVVLTIIPIIGIVFFLVLSKVRVLFTASQETIDWLNKIINESILGSALIRLLNSQSVEYQKFLQANQKSKEIWLKILWFFASMIPLIVFISNLAILMILLLWGHFVILWSMSLWDFAAFNGYLSLLIFPIIIIWFMSGVIAQSNASYGRILQVFQAPDAKAEGAIKKQLEGRISVKDVSLTIWGKSILKNISFEILPQTKTAILWPTAAGKTQLLYLMTWLVRPSAGEILYDHISIGSLEKTSFHEQMGLVFQDSALFQLSLRENIAFSNTVSDQDIQKAIETAELSDFIEGLEDKLDTLVSERGTSLSGGQKQRIMLARALALNPKILFLDDFTARLDLKTESKILENVSKNYQALSLVSVTQKIAPVKDYDQIILLMEWEILAIWTHEELMKNSMEYIQIYQSQLSTNQDYEL